MTTRRQFIVFLSGLPALRAVAAEPKPQPPLLACIEPAALRTDASRLMPGSRRTVIVPARVDADAGLRRLSKEEFDATGLTWAKFLSQAAAAAAAHLQTLKPDIKRNAKGTALYAVLKSESHLTAGTILCPEFFTRFREIFGDKLVVLIPDHFTVYVFPRGFSDFQNMGPEVLTIHEKATWPASQEAFEITPEGIKCLGAFDSGEDGGEPAAEDNPATDGNR